MGSLSAKKNLIIVDGEIGAGKTTFIQNLANRVAQRHTVMVVEEPVDEWIKVGILQKFYSDPERYAYEFQTYTYVTRMQKLLEAFKTPADVYILERSVLTDRYVFMALQNRYCPKHETNMYNDWWPLWEELMRPYDYEIKKMIYLKPSLSSCMSRVNNRKRTGELAKKGGHGGVSAEYQRDLRMAHEYFLEGKHRDEFPEMSERPFSLDRVLVLGPEVADKDFRPPDSELISTTANKIITQCLA